MPEKTLPVVWKWKLPRLPADLPSVRFPKLYAQARAALERCVDLDECKDWTDKAKALATYALEAKDGKLFTEAKRIQARAVRRCGELLREIKSKQGQRTDIKPRAGTGPKSRKQAAKDAGLSGRQQKTAMQVAKIPPAEFNAAVDPPATPPTVTALAKRGTHARPATGEQQEITKRDRAMARRVRARARWNDVLRVLRDLVAATEDLDSAQGISAEQWAEARTHMRTIQRWWKGFAGANAFLFSKWYTEEGS